MMCNRDPNRRQFMVSSAAAIGAAAVGLPAVMAFADDKPAAQSKPAATDVSPTEDLMREHGMLERLLLCNEEIARRLTAGKEFPLATLTSANDIVKKFIEDYHEKLEEDHVFPVLQKLKEPAGAAALVKTLLAQHEAGRALTAQIRKLSTADAVKDADTAKSLADMLGKFSRMYRPHAAREDTVAFPAFHAALSEKEFDALGDKFEDREHELFGEDGFEKMVAETAKLEKSLGIEDLDKFTPAVK